MNVPLPFIKSAHIAFALSMFLILERPLGGERVVAPARYASLIEASDALDDGLLFPDTDADDPPGSAPGGWMRFETNGCGQLQRIEDKKNLMTYGAFRRGSDDDDLDPSDEARAIFGRWLSAHPRVAVVNDAIARSCGSPADDQNIYDEDPAPSIEARTLDPKRESFRDHGVTIV